MLPCKTDLIRLDRLGSFPIEKKEGKIDASHVTSLFLDELSNHRCRAAYSKRASGKDAELIARLCLCAERETRYDKIGERDSASRRCMRFAEPGAVWTVCDSKDSFLIALGGNALGVLFESQTGQTAPV